MHNPEPPVQHQSGANVAPKRDASRRFERRHSGQAVAVQAGGKVVNAVGSDRALGRQREAGSPSSPVGDR